MGYDGYIYLPDGTGHSKPFATSDENGYRDAAKHIINQYYSGHLDTNNPAVSDVLDYYRVGINGLIDKFGR